MTLVQYHVWSQAKVSVKYEPLISSNFYKDMTLTTFSREVGQMDKHGDSLHPQTLQQILSEL